MPTAEADALMKKSRRQAWQPVSVFFVVLLPPLLFTHVCYRMSSNLRHVWDVAAFFYGPGLGLLVCLFSTLAVYRKWKKVRADRFFVTLCVCLWIAWLSATIAGEMHYRWYAYSYYMYQGLASYTNIDPAQDKGQSYMDAGQVYFKENVQVMTSKAVALANGAIYCVAPIVGQPIDNQGPGGDSALNVDPHGRGQAALPPSRTIDFWAVGEGCCESTGVNFKCGDVNTPGARSALRLLDDSERPFYLMAVQEWNAWIGLPSKHPLFFHWVKDPVDTIDKYLLMNQRAFSTCSLTFFALNAMLSLSMLWGLHRVGM
jgi:F0F1-type ATP synthase assembly protein I